MAKVMLCGRVFLSPLPLTSLNYNFSSLFRFNPSDFETSIWCRKYTRKSWTLPLISILILLKDCKIQKLILSRKWIPVSCLWERWESCGSWEAQRGGGDKEVSLSLSARSYLMITIFREERLGQLVGVDPGELVAAVEELVARAAHLRTEVSHWYQCHQCHDNKLCSFSAFGNCCPPLCKKNHGRSDIWRSNIEREIWHWNGIFPILGFGFYREKLHSTVHCPVFPYLEQLAFHIQAYPLQTHWPTLSLGQVENCKKLFIHICFLNQVSVQRILFDSSKTNHDQKIDNKVE